MILQDFITPANFGSHRHCGGDDDVFILSHDLAKSHNQRV